MVTFEEFAANLHLFPNLVELKELRFKRLPNLDVAPALGQLTRLTRLWLDLNMLTSLPTHLERLTEMQDLRVSSNALDSVPETLPFEPLTMLMLSNNVITSLPDALVARAMNIEQLWADSNAIAQLPSNIGRMTTLRGLGVAHNHLTSLPVSVSHLSALTALRVDYNDMAEVPMLTELTALEGVWISANTRLHGLDMNTLADNLPRLQYVNALDTPLNAPTLVAERLASQRHSAPVVGPISLNRLPPPIGAFGVSYDASEAPLPPARAANVAEPPLFMSIGPNCAVAEELHQLGVRDCAGPFDWVDCSAQAVVSIIASRFERYPSPLSVTGGWWDATTDISYHHDDWTGNRDAENDKYARRIARMREALDRSGHLVMIRYGKLRELDAMTTLSRVIRRVYNGAKPFIYLLTTEVEQTQQHLAEDGMINVMHRDAIAAIVHMHRNATTTAG